MGQPLEMSVLPNDIIKAVLLERKELGEKKRKKEKEKGTRQNLPKNLHISPYDPHRVVVRKFNHLRQIQEKLIEIARRRYILT